MELVHFVYNNYIKNGEATGPVPVCSTQDETYLYRTMTGQRLKEYEFWQSHEADDQYFLNVAADCEYVCVFTDCDQYGVHRDFWEQMDVVYENRAGKIIKVPYGKLKYWK